MKRIALVHVAKSGNLIAKTVSGYFWFNSDGGMLRPAMKSEWEFATTSWGCAGGREKFEIPATRPFLANVPTVNSMRGCGESFETVGMAIGTRRFVRFHCKESGRIKVVEITERQATIIRIMVKEGQLASLMGALAPTYENKPTECRVKASGLAGIILFDPTCIYKGSEVLQNGYGQYYGMRHIYHNAPNADLGIPRYMAISAHGEGEGVWNQVIVDIE